MAFFKTKQEKEIIAKMEREEQMETFNEQINELKSKRQEYAKIAAEALLFVSKYPKSVKYLSSLSFFISLKPLLHF